MRGKEDAHDYRYFSDPDLLPLVIDDEWVEATRKTLPELPEQKKARFIDAYSLPAYDAGVLSASRDLADYFEACVDLFPKAKPVSNWIMGPLQGLLNTMGKSILETPVSPGALAELLELEDQGVISNKIAKTVFEDMAATGASAKAIVDKKGLVQVSDVSAIEKIVDVLLDNNPKEVAAFKNGKTKLMGFFVGQVMRETKGKADPKIVNQLLKEKLAK
jgi:aspartyl-tRNA(Asn)/glutamyl-tRNA(Gln) amidotransferase subunit B